MEKSLSIGRRITFWLATRCGWLLLLAIGYSIRIRVIGRHHLERLRAEGRPFIICTWHGKILIPIFIHRFEKVHGMVSQHADGEMIAQTIQRLGYATVRGSSSRGGSRAMIAMIRALRNGGVGAIMPDGPKGPRHLFKPGAIVIAQKAGAYLLPLTFACSRCWRLKSWDRFTIPVPFSKAVVIYGEPIRLSPAAPRESLEAVRKQVEDRMIAIEQQAEATFNPQSSSSVVD